MSTFRAAHEFEKYQVTVAVRDGCTFQLIRDPSSGHKTWQPWRRGKRLGQGGFGEVWQEVWEDAHGLWHYRAVKSYSEQKMQAAQIDYRRELAALATFSRPECADWSINLYGWWIESGTIFVAMEYLGFGDLSRYVEGEISEMDSREIAKNVLQGLDVMHREEFTHRDIKPQNILVHQKRPEFQRWSVKIADFGISKQILTGVETALRTTTGTRPYCAPEVLGHLDQYHESSIYSNKVDMWSFGCVLFNLGSWGQLPFSKSGLLKYCNRLIPFNPRNFPIHFSNSGQLLMHALLQAEPTQRPSAAEALGHPWFSVQSFSAPRSSSNLPTIPHTNDRQYFNSFLNSSLSTTPVSNLKRPVFSMHPATTIPVREVVVPRHQLQNMSINRQNQLAAQPPPINSIERQVAQAPLGMPAVSRTVVPGGRVVQLIPQQSLSHANANNQILDIIPGVLPQQTQMEQLIVTKWLKENKKKMLEVNKYNQTPLHLAAVQGQLDIVKRLQSQRADVHARDVVGATPLHATACYGQLEVIKLLAEQGADLHARNDSGWTLLHCAAYYDKLDVIKWLHRQGVDLHAKTTGGDTALHAAACSGWPQVIEWLVEYGSSINAKNDLGLTPLHYAAYYDRLAATVWFVEHGGDMNVMANNGHTPRSYAMNNSKSELTKWLKRQESTSLSKSIMRVLF